MSTHRLTSLFLALVIAPFCRATDVTFTIDPTKSNAPISPWIYGINPNQTAYGVANPGLNQTAYQNLNLTMERLGGDRWTAYNWTNNASNAGTDYELSNDAYLSSSSTPGDAEKGVLSDAASRNAMALITVPINGYLAADESGPVPANVNPANSTHFVPEFATQSEDPSPAANHVYEDQFVDWVKANYASSLTANSAHPVAFSLDNEPDLWSTSHPEVHPAATTYAEIVSRTTDYAKAIKAAAPNAIIDGPVSYGWDGFETLQAAPDSAADNAATDPYTGKPYGDFLSYYLAQVHTASTAAGVRLVDTLDVHWYPEAQGNNASGTPTRITSQDTSPGVAAARMHAARSLWDPNYVENSYITQDELGGTGIDLIPRLQAEIAANYAGTKLSISEYNYGGGADISGGVAEADVLGVFGKYGIYSAAEWPLADNESFILGAMKMYRNFDGKDGSFGDTSISATSVGETADTSIYASTDSNGSGRLVLVAINESTGALAADIALQNLTKTYSTYLVYQLTSSSVIGSDGSATPTYLGSFPIADLADYSMPGESVSTIVLTPVPEPVGFGLLPLVGAMLLRRRRR